MITPIQDLDMNLLPGIEASTFEDFMKEPGTSTKEETPEDKLKKDKEYLEGDDSPGPIVSINELPSDEIPHIEETPEKSDPNKVWAEWARQKGFIEYKDEEFKPEEGESFLEEKLRSSVEQRAKELREAEESDMPNLIKDLREKYREGIDIHELVESKARSSSYKAIKEADIEDNIDLQKDIISVYLGSQGLAEDKIAAKITRLEDAGLLKEEAKDNIRLLVQSEEKYEADLVKKGRIQEEDRKKEVKEGTKKFEEYIMNSKELFENLPWTDKEKKVVSDSMLKVVGKAPNGQPINEIGKMRLQDPNFDLKVAYMAKILKWDMTPIKKMAKTEATKEIKKSIGSTYVEKTNNTLDKNYAAAKKAMAAITRQQNIFNKIN